MPKSLPIPAGTVFSRLTVIERAPNSAKGYACYRCRCECGTETIVQAPNLRNKHTQSCGCLQRDKARDQALRKAELKASLKYQRGMRSGLFEREMAGRDPAAYGCRVIMQDGKLIK